MKPRFSQKKMLHSVALSGIVQGTAFCIVMFLEGHSDLWIRRACVEMMSIQFGRGIVVEEAHLRQSE